MEKEATQERFDMFVEEYGWAIVRDVVANGALTWEQAVDWVFNYRKIGPEMEAIYSAMVRDANRARRLSQEQKKNSS